jgi:hypothetical protein
VKESEQLREKQQWHDETKRSLEREIVASQERENDAGVPKILDSTLLVFCLTFVLFPSHFSSSVHCRQGRHYPRSARKIVRREDHQKPTGGASGRESPASEDC